MSFRSPKVNEPGKGRGFWGVGRACKNPCPTHPPKRYKNRLQQGSALSVEIKEKVCVKNVVY